jgi:hypothetical protein
MIESRKPGSLSDAFFWLSLGLDSQSYIKNAVAVWADKKPFLDFILLLEHGVKTIFVSTLRTDLELYIHFHGFDFVIHIDTLLVPNFRQFGPAGKDLI